MVHTKKGKAASDARAKKKREVQGTPQVSGGERKFLLPSPTGSGPGTEVSRKVFRAGAQGGRGGKSFTDEENRVLQELATARQARAAGVTRDLEQEVELRKLQEERAAGRLAQEAPIPQEEVQPERKPLGETLTAGGLLLGGEKGIFQGEVSENIVPFSAGGAGLLGTAAKGGKGILSGIKLGKNLKTEKAIITKAQQVITKKVGKNQAKQGLIRRALSNDIVKKAILGGLIFATVNKVQSGILSSGDNQIKSLESALGLMSEEVPDIFKEAAVGATTPEFALDEIDTLLQTIDDMEAAAKVAQIYSISAKTNPEFMTSFNTRLRKQRRKFKIAETEILKLQISGVQLDPEAIALIMRDLRIDDLS